MARQPRGSALLGGGSGSLLSARGGAPPDRNHSGSRRLNRIHKMVGTMNVTAPVSMAITGPVASRTARNTNTVINNITS